MHATRGRGKIERQKYTTTTTKRNEKQKNKEASNEEHFSTKRIVQMIGTIIIMTIKQ